MKKGLSEFCPFDYDFVASQINLQGKKNFSLFDNEPVLGELLFVGTQYVFGYYGDKLLHAASSTLKNMYHYSYV